ncbi:hypothetical protein HHI36_022614, partial [Cryptolaemus montrouzieri]
ILQAIRTNNYEAETSACPISAVLSVVSPLPTISNKNKTAPLKQQSLILSSTPMMQFSKRKGRKEKEVENIQTKKYKTKINSDNRGKLATEQENVSEKKEKIERRQPIKKKE